MVAERPPPRYLLHLGLFLGTCLTTTWAGASQVHPELSWFAPRHALQLLPSGLAFSSTLMAILLSHEMGHYVAARVHGVAASLPLFLPLPVGLVGTLGAVIALPRSVSDRNALVDIGAAGPLAGLLVALPLLAYGIHLSPVAPSQPGGLVEGNSILYLLLKLAIKGRILPGGGLDVQLHPVAWAGWVGLLVTMINLLPIGQLDGGHIATAWLGERQARLAPWLHRALLLVGAGAVAFTAWELAPRWPLSEALLAALPAGMPWLIWWLLLTVLRRLDGGRYHPPVAGEALSPGRQRLCWAMLALLMLIASPIPLRIAP
ncbi:MAG: site-2 protease family protein [Proteobacteria bacterium]|nr:site-2 protease family protein [Pseudomonadota bacterium]